MGSRVSCSSSPPLICVGALGDSLLQAYTARQIPTDTRERESEWEQQEGELEGD